MNHLIFNSETIGVVISLIAYGIGIYLRDKTHLSIFNPLLISISLVILFLITFRVSFESYDKSAKYLSYLLAPATVSLAVPLYRQIKLLKQHAFAIICSVLTGVAISLCSILLFSVLFGLSHRDFVTLLPKSITTAIGMDVSKELGGYVTISVAVIIVTGVFGSIAADFIFKVFKVRTAIARGLAAGTSAHAVGTAKAMEMGEIEGAMSSLAVVIAGIVTVILASIFAGFY